MTDYRNRLEAGEFAPKPADDERPAPTPTPQSKKRTRSSGRAATPATAGKAKPAAGKE